ncbi:hypothetical protein QAD02_004201 [Eretmocerus hayati]|uniref:Uncharacterized protein n=1 Tax=Eretmocerus hayati TaxID=131215 RepID=A0ACC2NNW3_9HYME|nr:hypothetical protein QAD02_004201 [Eretmocerus hayati]
MGRMGREFVFSRRLGVGIAVRQSMGRKGGDWMAPYGIFVQNSDNSAQTIEGMMINRFLINTYKDSRAFEECLPEAKNKVFISKHLMETQDIINNIPTELTMDEITENIEAYGICDFPPSFTRPAPANCRLRPPTYVNLQPNFASAIELGPNFMLGEVDMHVLNQVVEQACLKFASGQAFQHRKEDMKLVVEIINSLANVHKAQLEKEKTILARRKSNSETPQVLIQSDSETSNCLNPEIDNVQRNIQIPNLLKQNVSETIPGSNPNIQRSTLKYRSTSTPNYRDTEHTKSRI